MKVAIFGSCVSRDTAEYLPNTDVLAYVARQSVTSLVSPRGTLSSEVVEIESPFQKKNVISDIEGTGLGRVVQHADQLDLVLIDLVDERRGFWRFPDGSTVTNSLEAEACGYSNKAKGAGARLIEFGTTEHYVQWQTGITALLRGLQKSGLWSRTVFVDLQWAAALNGAPQPRTGLLPVLARRARQLRRGTRQSLSSLARGDSSKAATRKLWIVKPTAAEEFAMRAQSANLKYAKYSEYVRSMVKYSITRKSSELRIDRHHKWGPQPFHYRPQDYESVASELQRLNTQSGNK